MNRILSLSLVLLMILTLFAGCGAAFNAELTDQKPASGEGIYDSSAGSESAQIANRKLIRTITIRAETKDLDALLAELDAQIATLEGYVQSKQVNGSATTGRRSASMTLRIPAEKLDQFVSHVSDQTNVLSMGETTEDVTLKFIATESRIAALEAEEARVMELIPKAENLSELLVLESKLADIRQELEEVKSQLKLYENLVDYGTIHLTITEEKEYTEVEEEEPTVWQRISTGLGNSFKALGTIITELFIFFVVASPFLIIPAAIAITVLIRVRIKKKKAQNQPPENNTP